MSESRLAIVIDSKDSEKEVSDLTKRLNALEKAGIKVTNAANDNSVALDKSAKSADKYAKSTDNATKRMTTFNGIAKKVAATVATIGFVGLIKNTIDTADELGKLSTRLGIAVDELSRLHYAARLTGVTTQTLNMGLQRMTRRVAEAANGTGEAVGALQELNLSAEALNQLSPDQQFKALADALQDVENPADKVRLAMKLLDSEGVALIQTMEGGADAIERMGEESDRTGNTISAEFAAKAAEANDAITKLTATGQGMLNEFVVLLAPALQQTAEYLSDNATEIVIVTGAIASLTVGLKAARLAQLAFNTAVKANPYVLVASLIGTATVALIGYLGATKDAQEETEKHTEALDRLKTTIAELNKEELERNRILASNRLADEEKKLESLNKKLKEYQSTINEDRIFNFGVISEDTYEAAGNISKINDEIEATESSIKDLKDTLELLDRQQKKNIETQDVVDQKAIKDAIDTLQALRQGYDQVGLAQEKYQERQEQLRLLLDNGKITNLEYNKALAESSKQFNDVKFGITEAKQAYEALRAEYDPLGVAGDKLTEQRKQLKTLLDQNVISEMEYSRALKAVGDAYDEVARKENPHLAAQDALAERYTKNKNLLDELRIAQAAANQPSLPGMTPSGAGFLRSDNVVNQARADVNSMASEGLTGPTYNADDLEGTAKGMEEYQRQYEIRLAQLKEFENEKYGVQEEATAAREALEKSHEEKMKAYREQMLSAQISSTANMFGSLLSVSSQYFGESSALTKTFFYAQQAAQIAQSIMSINTGIANASALPFPANIPAMASVVSATAGLVSNIMSVSSPPTPNYNANTNFAGEFATGGNIPKGKWGIVGETGQPEIVHGPASVTGVKDTAKILQGNGSNTVNITVNYTNNGNTSDKDARKQGNDIADLVKSQVLQVIQQQTRPGGMLY